MQETTTSQETHPCVRKRNIMLILAAAATIAGLCHAYCTYAAPATPTDTPATDAPAEP